MLLMKYMFSLAISCAFLGSVAFAQNTGEPIIDVHLHSYNAEDYHTNPDLYGNAASANPEEHFNETYQLMRKNNIVLGIVSNNRRSVLKWMQKDVDGRLWPGSSISSKSKKWTPESFEQAVIKGEVKVFGEVGPYYAGKTISDPVYAPYLAICEKYGIPLALHTGGGPPQIPYKGAPNARLTLSNPFLAEDMLVKYPKLKVYLMHSGVHYYEEALRLMLMYPRVYSDLGVILWVHELPKHYGEEFLKLAKKFGMLKRVMYGTDQMVWPHAIDLSIKQLNSFDFLTESEKRDIFYNNAARFLELDQATIDKHHAAQ